MTVVCTKINLGWKGLTNIQHQFTSNELGVFGREGPAVGSFECGYEHSSSKGGGGGFLSYC